MRLELKDENTQCVGYPQAPPEPSEVPEAAEEAPAAGGKKGSPAAKGSGVENGRYLCVIMPMRI